MIEKLHKPFRVAVLPVLCFAFILVAPGCHAQSSAPSQKTGKLIVNIAGIRNTEGDIRVALRTDENTVVTTQVVDIDPKTLTAEAVFDNLAEGDYGVAVIHDENKNGKLDFNEVGMPLEGYGHSNNPSKRPGPPDFNETKFGVAGPDTTITINLIYWP
jgi:uncharacterized protein (DUF2141 family)